MSGRVREVVFLVAAVGVAALLVPAFVDLAGVDPGDTVAAHYLEVGLAQRRSYNVVSSVIFDYRGFDTVFEQLILFAAVVGVSLLLRVQSRESDEEPRDARPSREVSATAGAIRLAGIVLAGVCVLVAVYIILAVHVTPGGGFQSGVLIAGGLLAIYLADEYALYDRLNPTQFVETVEASAAAAYLAVGLLGLMVGGTFLANVLPLQAPDGLYAGGTIWVLNLIVGFEVTAGFSLIFGEFLEQAVLVRERGHS